MPGGAGILSIEPAPGVDPSLPGGRAAVRWSGGGRPDVARLGRRMLGLERDLSSFHASVAGDPDLSWVPDAGAGGVARGSSVFEDVVRTILTTNCAWSSTVAMCSKLVDLCGEPSGVPGRKAFPSPATLAAIDEQTLRDEVRVGYRAASLIGTATLVAEGRIELEAMAETPRDQLPDSEVERSLLSLPGVGPYAAAHAMLLLGRPAQPILDSWTRPRYARITGLAEVGDRRIRAHMSRHGPDAGLALWLLLTRHWFDGSRVTGP